MPFEAEEIFAGFSRNGVAYVVVGGLAAVLHGSPLATFDVDVCPSRDPGNLERLAKALREMDAKIRTADAPDGLPFACDARFLARVSLLNLVTRFGDLDLAFTPSGTKGYAELEPNATRMNVRNLEIPVASLDDVIRSKEAAGRDKDRAVLPVLRRLKDEIEKRGG